MARDRHERRHRRTARNHASVAVMTGANFDAVPSLSEAMGLEDSMFGIWCHDENDGNGDWMRELPSKVDDGGTAILAFDDRSEACIRAAKHYACETYADAKRDGWCEVRRLSGNE